MKIEFLLMEEYMVMQYQIREMLEILDDEKVINKIRSIVTNASEHLVMQNSDGTSEKLNKEIISKNEYIEKQKLEINKFKSENESLRIEIDNLKKSNSENCRKSSEKDIYYHCCPK